MKESQSQGVLMSKHSWAFLQQSNTLSQTFQCFREKQCGVTVCGFLQPEKRCAMTASPPCFPKSSNGGKVLRGCNVPRLDLLLLGAPFHGTWHPRLLRCSCDVPQQRCRQDGFPSLPAIPLRTWSFSFNAFQNHLGTLHRSQLCWAARPSPCFPCWDGERSE